MGHWKSLLSDIKVSPLLSSGSTFCPKSAFLFLWVSEQTAIIYFPVPRELKTCPGPTHPPAQWVSAPLSGEKRLGLGVDRPTLSNAEVKERVEV
jgi:hypothetical protein